METDNSQYVNQNEGISKEESQEDIERKTKRKQKKTINMVPFKNEEANRMRMKNMHDSYTVKSSKNKEAQEARKKHKLELQQVIF
jgi:hypothetical protein